VSDLGGTTQNGFLFRCRAQAEPSRTSASSVLLDREAGLKAYADAEKPSQAKKRQK
jgi:hypothetical protein